MDLKTVACFILVSCSATPPNILQQKPTVFYSGKTAYTVIDKIKSNLAVKNFDFKSGDNSKLIFEKHLVQDRNSAIVGSEFDPRPLEEVTFSLVEKDSGTRVTANYFLTTDRGSPLEKKLDLSLSTTGMNVQTFLDNIKMEFEMESLARVGVMVDSAGRIVGTTSGGGAAEAGLLAGDSLIQIDDKAIPTGNPTAISRLLAGPADSKVEIRFIRNGEANNVSVTRKKL